MRATVSASALRRRAHRLMIEARWLANVALLPPPVALFQVRARRLAHRTGDVFSLGSVTRPADLRLLLAVARGRTRTVELGTATGWTAISLALADPRRRVLTYDVVARPEPQRYMSLVSASARERIELVTAAGEDGPKTPPGADGPKTPPGADGPKAALGADGAESGDHFDLLYIDSSHDRQQTVAEVLAWSPALRPGAVIVFDDYPHPAFPGVREAVSELGLEGEQRGTLFIHTVGSRPVGSAPSASARGGPDPSASAGGGPDPSASAGGGPDPSASAGGGPAPSASAGGGPAPSAPARGGPAPGASATRGPVTRGTGGQAAPR